MILELVMHVPLFDPLWLVPLWLKRAGLVRCDIVFFSSHMPHKRKASRELERFINRAWITAASVVTTEITGQPPQHLAQPYPTNQTNSTSLTTAAVLSGVTTNSTTATAATASPTETTVTATEPEITSTETTSH